MKKKIHNYFVIVLVLESEIEKEKQKKSTRSFVDINFKIGINQVKSEENNDNINQFNNN